MLGGVTLRRFQGSLKTGADELALCRRIGAGEKHLFGQIVDQYAPLVAGVIAAQGAHPADVEDLAQRVFINVYRGLAGFRGEAKLSSWIYRIALNVTRAHLKRQSQRANPGSVEEAIESGRAPLETRAESAAGWARRQALRGALSRLAEPQRIALSLYYFEELSYEEISAAMRLNINTVRTHIRRGKQSLADLLDESVLEM